MKWSGDVWVATWGDAGLAKLPLPPPRTGRTQPRGGAYSCQVPGPDDYNVYVLTPDYDRYGAQFMA